jgi:hypothetical protein
VVGLETEFEVDKDEFDKRSRATEMVEDMHKYGLDCVAENDSSLYYGYECVFAPMQIDEIIAKFAKVPSRVFDDLRFASPFTHDYYAGMHVHVSPVSDHASERVCRWLEANRNQIEIVARRKPNSYCRISGDTEDHYSAWHKVENGHYELRIFAGPTSPKHVVEALKFVKSLVQWAEGNETVDEFTFEKVAA